MSSEQFEKTRLDKFALKPIYKKDEIRQRLHEVKQSFYNRLESRKLIRKQGKIPFMEHMTITHTQPVRVIADSALNINPDIKRELSFYNVARANVMKAMEICVQAKVPIDRPEDFFAEMIKTDDHMKSVKQRLLKQQHKI